MFKALIAYDGTHYFGWQKTVSGPSIQEEIQKALARITGETVISEAASRTDRGVHAEAQVIQFALAKGGNPDLLLKALNAVLPPDIRVLEVSACTFHPTLDATGKEYHYHLHLGPFQSPTRRLYSWHFIHPLDESKIQKASQDLIGKKDFSAFANEEEKDPICSIESIDFKEDRFEIRGNRFLYKMVRNIVGTLVYIGAGRMPVDCIPFILASRDRKNAAITAPAHGLYLHQVFYQVK